jgi:aminoglycoside phosphotransferase (APT) family kinase protein
VGTGRTADVFERGSREVLRRYRAPRDTELEVAAMEHARGHGYPVPTAQALSDTEIVMERLEGPTMLDDLGRRPWRIGRHARTLASLLHRLHEIEAPAWLPTPFGDGEALLHLDLHPDNVMLTPRGPYVIDWPNAARGPAGGDAAHTWLVLACSSPTTGAYRQALSAGGRRIFLRYFLPCFDRSELVFNVEAAGAYRLANRTLPVSEQTAIRRLLDRVSPPRPGAP